MHAWNPMCSGANFGTWLGRSHLIKFFPSCIYVHICTYMYVVCICIEAVLSWQPIFLADPICLADALLDDYRDRVLRAKLWKHSRRFGQLWEL